MTDADKAEVLTSILTAYTAQLEEMDRFAGNLSISVISIAVAIMTAGFAFSENNESMNRVFSYILLSIPCLILLMLYVFALMMRRVAIYRGNCVGIEKELRKLTDSKNIDFHGGLIKKYYGKNGRCASEGSIRIRLLQISS